MFAVARHTSRPGGRASQASVLGSIACRRALTGADDGFLVVSKIFRLSYPLHPTGGAARRRLLGVRLHGLRSSAESIYLNDLPWREPSLTMTHLARARAVALAALLASGDRTANRRAE